MRKRRDFIKIASEKLDISPEALRAWLRDKDTPCPFGEAIMRNKQYTYYINMNRLDTYISGRDIKEAI